MLILLAEASILGIIPGEAGFCRQIARAESDTFRVDNISPGTVGLGINFLTADVYNKTDQTHILGLDLVADPGFSLIRVQRQYAFSLRPFEKKQIEAAYVFRRLTTEAFLRVRLGIPGVSKGGLDVTDFFFDAKYPIGDTDRTRCFDLSQFTKRETKHLSLYCYKGSLSEKDIDQIAALREAGFRQISDELHVTPADKIRLIFYPDAETKTSETGHVGAGLARGNNIVEIYNDSIKLDPYHEIAHIVAAQLGDPPALLNEGFAVYISEKLGADALRFLGSPGKTVHDITGANRRTNKLIPLDTLFTFTEIGSTESNPPVAYPEAASFVKFLIDNYGLEKFRRAYQSLRRSDDLATLDTNRKMFQTIYGKSLLELEHLWVSNLR